MFQLKENEIGKKMVNFMEILFGENELWRVLIFLYAWIVLPRLLLFAERMHKELFYFGARGRLPVVDHMLRVIYVYNFISMYS